MTSPKTAGPASGNGYIDAALLERLAAALETIGATLQRDTVNGVADPARVRVARDYDVLRGLLGRVDAPRPLRMHRDRTRAGGEEVHIEDSLPVSARTVVVESPGDGASGPVTECVDLTAAKDPSRLPLALISPTMPISRVEVVDPGDTLLAFGPSLPPIS